MTKIHTPHGEMNLPDFFPDGTYGFVRAVNSQDLKQSSINGMICNTFHLMNNIGIATMKKLGGIHSFGNYDFPIVSDSGGFQVFSMISENKERGEIRKNEIIFKLEDGSKFIFTPEKSIQMQFAIGSDVIMCLDYCTHPDDSDEINKLSVETTIRWAKQCKTEYDNQLKMRKIKEQDRPLIFGIIQGGGSKELRKYCADELIKLGFDGFGYGGWPLDSNNNLVDDILEYTAFLMPNDSIKYAMGLGKPEDIVKCYKMGYNLFDCVIPTREARRGKLYVFDEGKSLNEKFYSNIYMTDEKHCHDKTPLDIHCDCPLCKNYSKAYLYHLNKRKETDYFRLATMHNLRFYSKLMERIRNGE